MPPLTRFLLKIAGLLLAHQYRVLALVCLISVSAAFGASQIRFDDGARDLFVSSQLEYQQFENHTAQYPRADTDVIVHVTARNIFSKSQLETLRDFILDVQLVDGIDLAVSIFSLQSYNDDLGEFENLIGDDLGNDANTKSLLTKAHYSNLSIAPLISENLDETVIMLSVADSLNDIDQAKSALTEIEQLAGETAERGDMMLEMTGLVPIRDRIINRLTSDQIVMTGIGGLLGLLMSLLMFRNLWIGALNGIAPMIALLLTFGVYGFAGLEMNLITNAVPVLILVLAMADCIHMTYEMRKHAVNGSTLAEAIPKILVEMGPPCLLAGLTTMLALSGLFYSESPLIQSFAIAGIVGLFMTMIATIIIHPLVFITAWHFKAAEEAFRKPSPSKRVEFAWLDQLTALLVKRKYRVVAASVGLAVILLSQFLPIQTNYRFYEFLDDQDEMIRTLERTEKISSPVQSLVTTLKIPRQSEPTDSAVMADLGKAHEAVQAAVPDHLIVSLHSFRAMVAKETRKNDPAAVDEILELLPERIKDNLVTADGRTFNLSILVSDAPSAEIRRLGNRINAALGKAELVHLEADSVTGYTAMAAYVSDQMIWDLAISFLIAAFVCPLFIALWFRRWQYGVASILPNVIPILAVGAWLMASGWHLQFASAVALSIAFGVAIDDTVHMLNRLDIERKKPSPTHDAIYLVDISSHVSPALITTTLVLSVGLLSTLLSQIPTMTFFGMLCIVIFILALLADLLLLPPILQALGEAKVIRRSKPAAERPI
ncbi:MAG: hypothetical protein Pars2KO_24240 [Parasphingorhabdus sp.]